MERMSQDAVSPVIGVMLMLVVTIIIAAVVSAFAGGLADDVEQAPTASLDVEVYSLKNLGAMPPWGDGYYTPEMVIRHVSGDPLPTKDLRIITYVTNASGTIRGELAGEVHVSGKAEWTYFTDDQYSSPLYLNDMNRFPEGGVVNSSAGDAAWFGNASAVLRPGDILITPGNHCGNYDDNDVPSNPHENVGLNRLLGLTDGTDSYDTALAEGSTVSIRVVHVPSGKAIYDREVVVQ
ncbi:MAG: type IV pilin N-terminal domain-containing protein [Methanomicrobiales archaeon]